MGGRICVFAMDFKTIEGSIYGYKAAVIKELSEDPLFSSLVPKTVYISDMVFYKFLLEEKEVYDKIGSWLKASLENTGEEESEIFDELQQLLRERYEPFLKKEVPGLEMRVIDEIGKGKRVIVRSSGLEDFADTVNAGGNRSIPDVDPQEIYEAISEVVISYFSPKVLKVLGPTMLAGIHNPYEFKCPVFIQELVGDTSLKLDTEKYPVIPFRVLHEIAKNVMMLKEKFGGEIDSEWVLTGETVAISIVAFSREPTFGAACVSMLCSLGVGSAVRRTAIVNATHYLIPCCDGQVESNFFLEYPERETIPCQFSEKEYTLRLVQCRPAVPISIEKKSNVTIQQNAPEFRRNAFPYKSVVVGKGDVDGKFIISESISEAWEEYLCNPEKSKYAGCIVRHGAALEHAGIMFTERKMPVISVSDEVFVSLATKHDSHFAICSDLGICCEVPNSATFVYSEGIDQGVPLQLGGARIRECSDIKSVGGDFLCNLENLSVLWNAINEVKTQTVKLLSGGIVNVEALHQIQDLCSPLYMIVYGPLEKGIRVYSMILETLVRQAGDIRMSLLWYRLLLLFIESKIYFVFQKRNVTIETCIIELFERNLSLDTFSEKLAFLCASGKSQNTIGGRDFRTQVLYSIAKDESEKLPPDLREEYEDYHGFVEQYGLAEFSYKDISLLYQKLHGKKLDVKSSAILEIVLKGRKDISLAQIYLRMISRKVVIGGKDLQAEANQFILSGNGGVQQRLLAAQVVLAYGGFGDLEVLSGLKEPSQKFVSLLARLHICWLCPRVDQVFYNHQCGVLDQRPTELTFLCNQLMQDLDVLESCKGWVEEGLRPILSNISANLTNTVIDLFDIEGKSYANSLAMDIHGIYSTYLAHLEKWNKFLIDTLLDENVEYHEIGGFIDRKIQSLREKRNDRIAIELEATWYEKMNMDLDFNPHELQNILHQASIHFANLKNQFYPSVYVKKMHQSLITFGMTNRRLLKNQYDCIEVEMGLGNYKTHKSSILVGSDRISAVYTEAPLISMGRIIFLKHIFDTLSKAYPRYNLVTRLQERNEDHLLYVYMNSTTGNFSFEELQFGVNIVCSMFDAVELGGGTANRTAESFVKEFCPLDMFVYFLKQMVDYHSQLSYSDDMGGGMEDHDVCIYQSLIALMVMFPERYHVFKDAHDFESSLKIFIGDLKRPEWKTDRYDLREGWLESTYCMCLAIMYPAELRNALSEGRVDLPNPKLCDLYLNLVRR